MDGTAVSPVLGTTTVALEAGQCFGSEDCAKEAINKACDYAKFAASSVCDSTNGQDMLVSALAAVVNIMLYA